MAEHPTVNRTVIGSSPIAGATTSPGPTSRGAVVSVVLAPGGQVREESGDVEGAHGGHDPGGPGGAADGVGGGHDRSAARCRAAVR